MSFNGSGTYSAPASSWNPAVTNTAVNSTDWAALLADLSTALSTTLCKDGQSIPTANIPMGGFKLTGLAAGTATGNSLRYEQLFTTSAVALLGAMDWLKGADIASAATVNLTTATGNAVHITGAVTITAVTLGSGMWRAVVFDGALTLTHHVTNNNLPGGVNITTVAGDRALYWSDGTTVYCIFYQPVTITGTGSMVRATSPTLNSPTIVTGALGSSTATTQTAADNSTKLATTAYVDRGASGASWVLIQAQAASASATIDFTSGITSTYDEYLVTISDMVPATDATQLNMRVSQDGGSTFKSGGTDYTYSSVLATDSAAPSTNASTTTVMAIATSLSNSKPFNAWITFSAPAGTARTKLFTWRAAYSPSGSTISIWSGAGVFTLNTSAINAIRFFINSGNVTTGNFALYGLRKS